MTTTTLSDLLPTLPCGLGCDATGCGFCNHLPAEEQVGVLNLHGGRNASGDPVLDTLNASGDLVEAEGFGQLGGASEGLDQLGVGVGVFGFVHGTGLNVAFKQKSNAAFNNAMFMAGESRAMSENEMHPTMVRLYQAAERLRKVKGQSAVSRLLNVSPQVVKNWEARGVSKQGAISAQEVIGCSATWLMDGTEPMRARPSMTDLQDMGIRFSVPAAQAGDDSANPNDISGLEFNVDQTSLQPILSWEHPEDLPPGEFVMVPRLAVKLSAGNGHDQVEVEFIKAMPQAFRAQWIRDKRLHPNKLAAMTASGESMQPGIFNGDSLLVDTSQTEVLDGKVYALWYEGGERVKRLFRLPGGGLRIKSDNPNHPTIEVPHGDQEHVRILGRVVHRSGDGGLE